MYVSVMTDIMYRVLEVREIEGEVGEMNSIREYTNRLLETVSKTYNCKKYEINGLFEFN